MREKKTKPVPIHRRFLWGLGGSVDALMVHGVGGLIIPILNMGMGVDARILALAQSLPRLAAITVDPLIGHFSDNTRSRFGRRRPWMFAGTLLAALLSTVLWHVPGNPADYTAPEAHASLFAVFSAAPLRNVFVTLAFVAFFTFAHSLFTIPHTAQGFELTTDYDERTRLFAWRQCAYAAAAFAVAWLPNACVKLDILCFGASGPVANGVLSAPWVGAGLGLVILLLAVGPVCFSGKGAEAPVGESGVPLRVAARYTLENRAFRPLLLGNIIAKFGNVATGSLFMYVVVYRMCGGDKDAGTAFCAIFFNVINLANLLSITPLVKLTERLGKKTVMLLMLACGAVVHASVWFTLNPLDAMPALATNAGIAGWLENAGRLLALGWPAMLTGAGIGVFCNFQPLLLNSMLADVCDDEELRSGHRREAFHGAVFSACDKVVTGLALLLGGWLLAWSGFDAAKTVQPDATTGYWIRALLATQPVGLLLALGVMSYFPITRARAAETRRRLDQRASAKN